MKRIMALACSVAVIGAAGGAGAITRTGRDAAVGAVGGAVVAGPVGAVVGGQSSGPLSASLQTSLPPLAGDKRCALRTASQGRFGRSAEVQPPPRAAMRSTEVVRRRA